MTDVKPTLPQRPPQGTSSALPTPPPPTHLRDRSAPSSSRERTLLPPSAMPHVPRRRSSILSLSSIDDTRQSVQSSAGDYIRPGLGGTQLEDETASHWQSSPLAFAILPAIGGLFFQGGSAFVTDVLLLGLAAIFLNWSVTLPWDWYYSAQAAVRPYSPPEPVVLEQLNEDDESSDKPSTGGVPQEPSEQPGHAEWEHDQKEASSRLRIHELLALLATFVLPALSAYLLHIIRAQLSRPSESLVSDYNLSIFLLAAEIRPCRQLIRLITNRTLHLQRIANSAGDPDFQTGSGTALSNLAARLDLLESKVASNDVPPPTAALAAQHTDEVTALSAELRKRYEPRLDALERAVRRYEKRATTLSLLTENRMQSLETRLQDALSLAAVAAQGYQSRRGVVATLLGWISAAMMVPLEVLWYLLVWPLTVVEKCFRCANELLMGSTSSKSKRKMETKKAGYREDKKKDTPSVSRR